MVYYLWNVVWCFVDSSCSENVPTDEKEYREQGDDITAFLIKSPSWRSEQIIFFRYDAPTNFGVRHFFNCVASTPFLIYINCNIFYKPEPENNFFDYKKNNFILHYF